MLALDPLGVTFAGTMHFGGKMTLIGAQVIGVIARDAKRLQQRLQLQKHLIKREYKKDKRPFL